MTGSGSNLSGQTGSGIHGQSGLNMMLLPSKLFVQPITNNTSMLFDTLDTYLYDAYQSPKCWNLGLQHTMPQHSCFNNSIRGCCVYKHTSLCFVLFFFVFFRFSTFFVLTYYSESDSNRHLIWQPNCQNLEMQAWLLFR